MLKQFAAVLCCVGIALAGCGGKGLELPPSGVERAATCAAVIQLDIAKGKQKGDKVRWDELLRVLRYQMDDALRAESQEARTAQANATSKAYQTILDDLLDDYWEPLLPQCRAAYPEADPQRPVTLPQEPLEFAAACFGATELFSDFMIDFPDQRERMKGLAARANRAIDRDLAKFTGTQAEADVILLGAQREGLSQGDWVGVAQRCEEGLPP